MLQLAAYGTSQRSADRRWWQALALAEIKIADQQGLCVKSYHGGRIMAHIFLRLQLFLLAKALLLASPHRICRQL